MKKLNLKIFRGRSRNQYAPIPSMLCVDYMASDLSQKKYGDRFSALLILFSEDQFLAAIDSQEDYARIGKKLLAKFLAQPKYLEKLIAWSEARKNSIFDYISKNLNKDIIINLSDQQLAQKYQRFADLYRKFHLENTPSWWVGGDSVNEELNKELSKYNISNRDEVIAKLSVDYLYQTENLAEEISLLKLSLKLKKSQLANIKDFKELPAASRKLIAKHTAEFGYIPFGYNTGVVWDDQYFFKKIKEIFKEGDPEEILAEKLNKIKKEKSEQKQLIKELNLDIKVIALFKMIQELSYLQEIKKTAQTKSHPLLQQVVKPEIARRLDLPVGYLDHMAVEEVVTWLKNGKIPSSEKKLIGQRLGVSVLISQDLKYNWLIGKEAQEFNNRQGVFQEVDDLTEFKGSIAFQGIVRGQVKVCDVSTEINKVNQGDILVTAMTTPDFVPAMKKAAAIITDEGGITCHAAIVSRELKKPCIIGTKIATKVLKDGMEVEVDANKGVVKILN